ncbi:hypothetical protein COL922a_012677 [Colletotrichum nupharicola]|nr:hypothetical protein COL922a_012677 [Colletotrichum nupharicola]
MGEKPIEGKISSEWVIDNNAVLDAQAVLEARKKLARLANWRGPASTEAVSLCRAIGVTMDALFSSSSKSNDSDSASEEEDTDNKTLFWSLEACYAASKSQIRFRLRREDGKWKACADEIDAALSLWLSSVDDEASEDVGSAESQSTEVQDDTWLREKKTLTKQSLRRLGLITETLVRDLSWWVPRDPSNFFVFELDKKGRHVLNMAARRIVGCGREGETLNWQTRYWRTYLSDSMYGNFTSEVWDLSGPEKGFLAAQSHNPLKLLYAQDK